MPFSWGRLAGLAALVVAAGAVRLHTSRGEPRKASGPPMTIAGVPVHNFHRSASYRRGREENGTSSFVEVSEDWLVILHLNTSDEELQRLCSTFAGRCVASGHPSKGGVPYLEVRGSVGDLESHVDPREVEFIEPDFVVHVVPEIPSRFMKDSGDASEEEEPDPKEEIDVNAHPLWGLERIGLAETSLTGQGAHIYVLDSGIHASHALLGGRAVPTLEITGPEVKECNGEQGCAVDAIGHGTHCASIAAGEKIGVAPGATVHGVKIFNDAGESNVAWTIAALDWIATSADRPAVVSMSLGGESEQSRAEEAGINIVTNSGITVVVAAGNEDGDACMYSPSSVPSAITVGGIDRTDSRGFYSNYGSCVDLFAPGSDIAAAGLGSTTAVTFKTGTSMACPFVAGAVAMLLEADSGMTPDQARAALLESAEKGPVANRRGSPNLLLSLRAGKFQAQAGGGEEGSAAAAAQGGEEELASPEPRAEETASELPPSPSSSSSCPGFAEDPEPDVAGDCECKAGTACRMEDGYGCEWSVSGSRSKQYFSVTCRSCVCS